MRPRTILTAGLTVFAAVGAAGYYVARNTAPACDSDSALHDVTSLLRDQFHLDSIFVNNITTVTSSLFDHRRDCSAEVAVIRGNVNASDMPWRSIRYQIDQPNPSEPPTIIVQLGGDVPLAKPALPFWERLLAYL